jgi:hypothetical protein
MAADSPPPGPPPRDPTAPARLLDAAGDVSLRVERAHRRLDDLSTALERLAGEAGAQPGRPLPPPATPAASD